MNKELKDGVLVPIEMEEGGDGNDHNEADPENQAAQ